ncbi:uncharacterized protein METZ01_LOCUS30961 [marine metagenome]|uniref:Uncharacterized protein n=1 Tax=marine metagenome TaxID=408172 RepID=A0A381QJ37_9ZZZZ
MRGPHINGDMHRGATTLRDIAITTDCRAHAYRAQEGHILDRHRCRSPLRYFFANYPSR